MLIKIKNPSRKCLDYLYDSANLQSPTKRDHQPEKMMTIRTVLIPFIVSIVALNAGGAALHKCTNADGRVEYSDRQCGTGASAQKITVRENTVGNGDDLASVRAKDAEFNARQETKRQQEEKITAERMAEDRRRYEVDREHQDRRDLIDAVSNGNKSSGWAYPYGYHRPDPKPAAVPRPAPPAPSMAVKRK